MNCVGVSSNLLANSSKTNLVITGFNTDIEYNGVTYHVQTEDKGLDTPLILSLVYNRGTILASKRSPYNDLLIGNFNEKELSERLQRQHKLICAAIRAGRIEDLKQMNSRDAKQGNTRSSDKVKSSENTANAPAPTVVKPLKQSEQKFELKPLANFQENRNPPFFQENPTPISPNIGHPPIPPIQKPDIELPHTPSAEVIDAPIEITDADLVINETQSGNEIVLPPEAVEILTDFSKGKDNVKERLFIELLNEVNFRGGESHTVSIMVGLGTERIGLVGANIMIKVLGTTFRPLIFHAKTDSNGVAVVNLQIPQFNRGRAAVLLKAMSNNQEVELRRVIYPN